MDAIATGDSLDERREHEERVRRALETMPTEGEIADMSARFKAISEPSRLKILFALACGEMCVEHLTAAVRSNQSAVSHQLKTLRDYDIIKSNFREMQSQFSKYEQQINSFRSQLEKAEALFHSIESTIDSIRSRVLIDGTDRIDYAYEKNGGQVLTGPK